MPAVFDQGPPEPCPTPFNMAAYVLGQADRLSDKPALITTDGEVMRYSDLLARVTRVAGGLRDCGLEPGDRVLFRLGNSPRFPIAYLACIWAGLVPVPLSAQLTTTEVDGIAKQVDPAALLVDEGLSRPGTSNALVLHSFPEGTPVEPDLGDPNRLAYIVFTSGTGGKSRGVCHAHRAIWARRMMYDGWYGLREDDRVMHAGAFNWTYTLGTGLMDPWSVGATAIIPAPGTPCGKLMPLAAQNDVTIFAAAPGVYRQILKSDISVPTLRHGLSAGEHLSDNLRCAWNAQTGTDLHQAFGMSECSTFISGSPKAPARPGSSGRPQKGRKIAILEDAAPAPFGTSGALAIAARDPGLMLHYLGDAPPKADWFDTGDLAKMDEDGSITYLGRADDLMNAGGFRVSPLEVEACFTQLTGVSTCAAVEIKIKQDTSVIALFHEGGTDEHSLRAHAETHLARYKQPRLYIPVDALPYGRNGKLNRRVLRQTYEADNGWTHQT